MTIEIITMQYFEEKKLNYGVIFAVVYLQKYTCSLHNNHSGMIMNTRGRHYVQMLINKG